MDKNDFFFLAHHITQRYIDNFGVNLSHIDDLDYAIVLVLMGIRDYGGDEAIRKYAKFLRFGNEKITLEDFFNSLPDVKG